MKKFILLLCCLTLFCSGCIKTEEKIKINEDNTAVVSSTILVKEDIVNSLEKNPFDRLIALTQNRNPDFKAESVGQKGYTGVKLTYNINDITKEQIVQLKSLKSNNRSGGFLYAKNGWFVSEYEIDAVYDLERTVRDESGSMGKALNRDEIAAYFTPEFKIQLPAYTLDTNAGKVDKETNTYTWEILPNKTTDIKVRYKIYHVKNIVYTSLLALFTALFLLYKFFSMFKPDKKPDKGFF